MRIRPVFFDLILDHLNTQEICIKATKEVQWRQEDASDHFKTQGTFDGASKDLYTVQYIPDLFVTQDKVKIWHDDNAFYNDNELIDWYNYYK